MTEPTAADNLRRAVNRWTDTRKVRLFRTELLAADPWSPPAVSDDPAALAAADAARAQVLAKLTDTWATMPPLLRQLEAAVAPSGESGKTTGRGAASVVDWDAVDILDRLRGTATDWAGAAGLPWRPDLAGRLRQVAGHTWDPEQAWMLARIVEGLAKRADTHLTPPEVAPWRYVRTDCPNCGYRRLSAEDADGAQVTGFALVVEFHRHFVNRLVCQVCWVSWTRQDLSDWALAALGADQVPA